MLKLSCLFGLCLIAAEGLSSQQRIVGGSLTTINQYPFGTVILKTESFYTQNICGGTIINNRSVLSAAHCFTFGAINQFQVRVGSSFVSSGGVLHHLSQIINHPDYNYGYDSDVTILRVTNVFSFGDTVQPGRIAGSNYGLHDDQPVWVIGWGFTVDGGSPSEQLRHVQIWTVNQNICSNNYRWGITDNMLCAGYMNVGGRDSCTRDSGGPLLHNGVVVGIVTAGRMCGSPVFPGIYARVSSFSNWIEFNA